MASIKTEFCLSNSVHNIYTSGFDFHDGCPSEESTLTSIGRWRLTGDSPLEDSSPRLSISDSINALSRADLATLVIHIVRTTVQ